MKLSGMKPDTHPDQNPFAALLAKLSGISKPPIRARQGWQQYMHERNDDVIAPAVSAAWAIKQAEGLTQQDENNMSYRTDIAHELFNKLPAAEKLYYQDAVKKDKDAQAEAYKAAVERALSTNN